MEGLPQEGASELELEGKGWPGPILGEEEGGQSSKERSQLVGGPCEQGQVWDLMSTP